MVTPHRHMQLHILVVKNNKNNHAMLDGWNVGVSHILIDYVFNLLPCIVFCDWNSM
jgi:hypothetical protein